MKKLRLITAIVLVLIELLSCTSVFAGYENKVANNYTTESMYDTIIHMSDSKELSATDGRIYEKVSTMKDLKNRFKDNSIILIENNMIENIDFEWVKNILKDNDIIVLLGYENLNNEVTRRTKTIDFSELKSKYTSEIEENIFLEKGYYRILLDNEKLIFGQFLIKARNAERLLEDVNVSTGRKKVTNKTNDSTTLIEEAPNSRTATNHLLRFYWADSTVDNKIYSQPNAGDEYIRIHLYKGEVVYELGGEWEYNFWSGSDYYVWTFTQVHGLNVYGNYITGYMVVDKSCLHPDGDGWVGYNYGFNQSKPLYSVIQTALNSGSTEAPNHMCIRTVNGVIYYGTRVRTATSLYNGSGAFIQSAPVDSWVWSTSTQNMCGASNHHYMSIKGYSASKYGAMTTFSSTTFVNAGFNTNTPLNYKITTRWWT